MSEFYEKRINEEGEETFVPVDLFPGFPADGIWLVRRDGQSQTCLLHLADLQDVTPFELDYLKLAEQYMNDLPSGWVNQSPVEWVRGFATYCASFILSDKLGEISNEEY